MGDIGRAGNYVSRGDACILGKGALACLEREVCRVQMINYQTPDCLKFRLTNLDESEDLVTDREFCRTIGVNDYTRKIVLCNDRSLCVKVGQEFHGEASDPDSACSDFDR